eukprot:5481578-Ditylum_brightwellii.AAC.1
MNAILSLFASLIVLYFTVKNFIAFDDSVYTRELLPLKDDTNVAARTTLKESFVDTVVVVGAWRAPDESLSKAFKVRIEYGVRVALLYGSNTLFLTGGRNDAY